MGSVRNRARGRAAQGAGLAAAHPRGGDRPARRDSGQRREAPGRVRPRPVHARAARGGQGHGADRDRLRTGLPDHGAAHAPGLPQAGTVGAGRPPHHPSAHAYGAHRRTRHRRRRGSAAPPARPLQGHRQGPDTPGHADPYRPARPRHRARPLPSHLLQARPPARRPLRTPPPPRPHSSLPHRRPGVHPDRGAAAGRAGTGRHHAAGRPGRLRRRHHRPARTHHRRRRRHPRHPRRRPAPRRNQSRRRRPAARRDGRPPPGPSLLFGEPEMAGRLPPPPQRRPSPSRGRRTRGVHSPTHCASPTPNSRSCSG